MKKLFLVGLMMLAGSAWAEWVLVGETDKGGEVVSFWVDPSTIKKNGSRRKVWGITAYTSRDEFGAFSKRWQGEYDCKEEQARYLALSAHSERFAGAHTILANTINPKDEVFKPVAPGTIQSFAMEFVCSK